MKNLIIVIAVSMSLFGCSDQRTTDEDTQIKILSEEKILDSDVLLIENYDFSNMKYSEKYFGWKNPTTGGAIHINKNDEIELYQSFNWFGLKDAGYFEKISTDDLDFHLYVNGIGLGNIPSVLLTSELDINKSVSYDKIVSKLQERAYDIYCIK